MHARLWIATLGLLLFGACDGSSSEDVNTPPPDTSEGEALYQAHCAPCHGADALGDTGPAIVHELHHSDADLIAVMTAGKGTMPATDIGEAEAQAIVTYMRFGLSSL